METKINVADILKDKPVNTKLYSPFYGNCILAFPENMTIKDKSLVNRYFYADGRGCLNGEIMLFPSKEMRDWRKFTWKKGDVLFSKDDVYIIFEEFENDAYTRFKGKHYLWKEYDEEDYSKEETKMLTSKFEKANDNDAQTYINTIEKKLGGKLNLETLEVEADVNVGDVVSDDVLYGICTKVDNSNVYCDFGCDSANYNAPITKLCLQKENINVVMTTNKEAWYKEIEKRHHISIDRNTLEVRPEFKKGDIAFADYGHKQAVFIVSCKTDLSEGYNSFIALDLRGLALDMGCMIFFKKDLCELRLATEEEKKQLFDALAKEGKCWDADNKEVVALKSLWTPKPFDRVLVRDEKDGFWEPAFFFRNQSANGYNYQTIGGEWRVYCIPYEGNEHLLGTTKDVEG